MSDHLLYCLKLSNTHVMYNNSLKAAQTQMSSGTSNCKLDLQLAADIDVALTPSYQQLLSTGNRKNRNLVAQLTLGT